MGVARYEAAQSSTSQPRAEPVDKIGHRFFVQRAAFKLELAGNERFHHWHRQADQVEAETGVKRVGKRIHQLAEQAGQKGGVEAWMARFHCQSSKVPFAADKPRHE